MSKWWVVGALLCSAFLTGLLVQRVSTEYDPLQRVQIEGDDQRAAAGYTARLQAVIQEHRSLLYQINTLPRPELIERLDALEQSVADGAQWLGRIGEQGVADRLVRYSQQAVAARTNAGHPAGAAALSGPAHQAAEATLSALQALGQRLESAPRLASSLPPVQEKAEWTQLVYLIAGLLTLSALMIALHQEPHARIVTIEQAPSFPRGLHTAAVAIQRGSAGLSADGRAATRTVEELRFGLCEITRVELTHLRHLEEIVEATNSARGAMQRIAISEDLRTKSTAASKDLIQTLQALTNGLVDQSHLVGKPLQGALTSSAIAIARTESAAVSASELAGSVEHSQRSIESLRERASDVERLVTAVNAIAVQTNILALNAAIEAARAGENGRGFAVVADSVRRLAVQAQQHAREIAQRVVGIGEAADEAAAEVAEHQRLAQAVMTAVDAAMAQSHETKAMVRQSASVVVGLQTDTSRLFQVFEGLGQSLMVQATPTPDLRPVERTLELVGSELRHLRNSRVERQSALDEAERLAAAALESTGRVARGGTSVELSAGRILRAIAGVQVNHHEDQNVSKR